MWGTFDHVVFKVILGSFGALVSKWPVTRKQLDIQHNRVTFGTQGAGCTMGYLSPYSVQGNFGVIWCTCHKIACSSKTAGHRAKQIEIWDSGGGGGYL